MAWVLNQQEFFSSDSDVLDLDLARIEYKIQQGKRGHVSYASLKVISLIGAWTSIVLLAFIIASIVSFFTLIPDNISITLNNWILFLRSITDGYNLAMQNLPPSQATSTLKEDFSNALQTFYDVSFPSIRNSINDQFIQTLFPILSQVPTIAYDVSDMLWFVQSIWRSLFFFTSPTQYIFPSDRYYPFSIIFTDKNDIYKANGEFIDMSSLFPGVYEKYNDSRIKYIIGFDQHWYMYHITTGLSLTETIGHLSQNLQRISLNVISLQFYEPFRNELIVLNKTNITHWSDTNGLFSLQFTFDLYTNKSYWQLFGVHGINKQITYIQPFSNIRQQREEFQIHAYEIEVFVRHT
eukprot:365339_1